MAGNDRLQLQNGYFAVSIEKCHCMWCHSRPTLVRLFVRFCFAMILDKCGIYK